MRKRVSFFIIIAAMSCSHSFAGESVDIAAIFAVTGKAAEENAYSLQGVRWAVSEINKNCGVIGKQLNLLVIDNQSAPIGSDIAAKQADDANVCAIVGADWSFHSLAVAKVAQAKKIPMVSNYSTHPQVTKIGNYIFRICFSDDFQGKVMARFAYEDLNTRTAFLFTDLTSDFSLTLSNIFRMNFERLGGRIVSGAEYKLKWNKYDEQIKEAVVADADVFFTSGHAESGLIVKLAQDAGIRSIPLGGDGWDSPPFLARGGTELKLGYYCTHWSEHTDSGPSLAFVEKFHNDNKFGVGSALGYDAVMVLTDAIRRAGSDERTKIRDALANTRCFQGVTGDITFDANGDPLKSAVIMKIENGKRVYFKTLGPEIEK